MDAAHFNFSLVLKNLGTGVQKGESVVDGLAAIKINEGVSHLQIISLK